MEYDFRWDGQLTREMQDSFDANGFFVARNFMDTEELSQILSVLSEPNGILKHSYMGEDLMKYYQNFKQPESGETFEENGRRICRTLCMQPGNDVTGMVARSEKVVDTCEKLLRTEVYHWCSMFVIKDAKVGGEHVWHQDYGYWYNDGCLYPDMITLWIALDPCTKTSSCKQVLQGSHKMGRINHGPVASGQTGADEGRVDQIRQKCEHLYLEMEPGDMFVHHGNLLHRSEPNTSIHNRRAFMSCFNAAYNSPVEKSHYPNYRKIDKVKDAAIKDCKNFTNFDSDSFVDRSVNKMKRKSMN